MRCCFVAGSHHLGDDQRVLPEDTVGPVPGESSKQKHYILF